MVKRNFSLKTTRQKVWLLGLVLGFCLLNSCVTTKKTTYIQENRKSEISEDYYPPDTYLILPGDNLYIRVATPDPRLSSIFNAGGEGGITTADEATAQLVSYIVRIDGVVELPYVGGIVVGGKTLSQAKETIEAVLVDYISDADLTVRLVNSYITILGEVNHPGMFPIYKQELNIFQALAMAGDMAEYSDRYRLKIIRQTVDGSIVKEFDLTDENVIDSEFYYVMPNDVIYASPMKGKFFAMNQFPIGLILSSITTAVTLFILIQNTIILRQTQ